jgi:hypothetical protein
MNKVGGRIGLWAKVRDLRAYRNMDCRESVEAPYRMYLQDGCRSFLSFYLDCEKEMTVLVYPAL